MSGSGASVASTPKLNETQLAVLRWIGDGSPAAVMEGHGHRVSAAALRTRGLIKISGRSTTWRASLTPAGQAALGAQPKDRVNADAGPLGPQPKRRATSRATNRSLERIPAPRDLRGAHSLVTATRKAAGHARRIRGGRLRIGPQRGIAHIEVSRSLLRRALLVLHGLTKEALGRGWEVVPYPEDGGGGRHGIAIKVRGHAYPVELDELTERLPLSSRGSRGVAAADTRRPGRPPQRDAAAEYAAKTPDGSTAPGAADRLSRGSNELVRRSAGTARDQARVRGPHHRATRHGG